MTRLSLRPLLVLGVAAALSCPTAVITTAATAADTGAGAGSTALGKDKKNKKDKKKKQGRKPDKKQDKKKEPLTATVNATLIYTQRAELNNGEETQKLTITINDAEATFRGGAGAASGKGQVTVAYEARFYTDNRSWHAGCDTELVESKASWSGKSDFGVFPTSSRRTPTGSVRLSNGWGVEISQIGKNLDKAMATTGYYNDWESILMENCLTYPINEPLGSWSPYLMPTWTANGNLNGGGKGAYLSGVESYGETAGSASGKIEFSRSVTDLAKGPGSIN